MTPTQRPSPTTWIVSPMAHLRSVYGELAVPSRSAATRVAFEHRLT